MTIIFYDMSRKKKKKSVFISDALAASALTAAAMFIESPSDIYSVLGIFLILRKICIWLLPIPIPYDA